VALVALLKESGARRAAEGEVALVVLLEEKWRSSRC